MTTPSPTPSDCDDSLPDCLRWTQNGECAGVSRAYLSQVCPKACGICIPRGTAPTAPPAASAVLYAYAVFSNMNGVQGVVNFAQIGQETTVSVTLSGLASRALHYGVASGVQFTSLPQGAPSAAACETRFVQGVFNPTGANAMTGLPVASCAETDPATCSAFAAAGDCDVASSPARTQCPISCRVCTTPTSVACDKSAPTRCAVGDLSGKFGTLNGSTYSATYKDSNLALLSIVGKSLVIEDVFGANLACAIINASLMPGPGMPPVVPGPSGPSIAPVLPTLSPATCIDLRGETTCKTLADKCTKSEATRNDCRKTCGQCWGNCQVSFTAA